MKYGQSLKVVPKTEKTYHQSKRQLWLSVSTRVQLDYIWQPESKNGGWYIMKQFTRLANATTVVSSHPVDHVSSVFTCLKQL